MSVQVKEPNVDVKEFARSRNVEVGNALNILRPTLGNDAGVALYRLLRLVALEDIMGRGAAGTAYVAGKKLGLSLGLTKLADFLELCKNLKVGVIEVPLLGESRIRVDVYECVTCAGLKTVGRPLCHFEGGLIAGVVESILNKRTRAHEVACIGGLGDKMCGFDLELKPIGQPG
ncbi:V4R domain-containing protein [Pendulispora albinea]|uniref:4-vinyl reductase 4VR domain-containing protein n=1 Tax=Pendulispora albinea TaxID=2741071 RepID=A0ABZ2LZ63_9BACT